MIHCRAKIAHLTTASGPLRNPAKNPKYKTKKRGETSKKKVDITPKIGAAECKSKNILDFFAVFLLVSINAILFSPSVNE